MINHSRPETTYKNIFFSFFNDGDCRETLQDDLTRYFGVSKIIFTQSARSGLYFLLKSLPHKKVFIPSYTCSVVAEAAKLANKEIVFIDIRLNDYNMNVELLQEKIIPHSIIIATHQFGIPCDIEDIIKIAEANQCYVIEDNAMAFGSEYKGKKTGSFAGASVISFDLSKTLVGGRGGAILFNDEKLFEKVKMLFDKDSVDSGLFFAGKVLLLTLATKFCTEKFIYGAVNFFFRKRENFTIDAPISNQTLSKEFYLNKLDDRFMKLAFLNFQRILKIITRRNEISTIYFNSFKDSLEFDLPSYQNYKTSVFMRFPVLVKGKSKSDYYLNKNKKGLNMGFVFPYSCDANKKNSPNAYIVASSVLNIPLNSCLSDSDILKIISIIK